MDKERIEKFICELRKEKKMKQQEIADKINRKSVSKQKAEALLKLKFEMKQKKRQQKHKGR